MTSRSPLDATRLRQLAVDKGKLADVVVTSATGSTNTDLAAALAGGASTWTAHVTDHQTAGKGRHGRPWVAPRYSQATLSLALRPPQSALHRLGLLPLAAGLAVIDAVRDMVAATTVLDPGGQSPTSGHWAIPTAHDKAETSAASSQAAGSTQSPRLPGDDLPTTGPANGIYAPDTTAPDAAQYGPLGNLIPVLKWPNDALIGGRKVCGILAEAVSLGQHPAIVVGLGLNVSLTANELPVAHATSLDIAAAELGYELHVDRTMLVAGILQHLVARCEQFQYANPTLLGDYRRACGTIGTRVRVHLPGERILEGMATGVNDTGELIVVDDHGAATAVAAGDVSHLRRAKHPK
ncbi:biotin--[acetyl-CoA-carboxylase] ligase [Corynebacterium choanae]|nr:biotin--[acetyl-CoA-carboxylase] ligase [Corynebacterium choanae]